MPAHPVTDGDELLEVGVDLVHVGIGQLDHPGVLLDPLHLRRAGDGDDDRHPGPLREAGDPVDGELRRRAALARGPLLHLADQPQVGLQVRALAAGARGREAPLRKVLGLFDLPCQDALRERRVAVIVDVSVI